MLAFQKKRDALIASHEGKLLAGGQAIDFGDAAKATAFGEEFGKLTACEIEIPGDPILIEDIRSGVLVAADHTQLKPFFVPAPAAAVAAPPAEPEKLAATN